ncbi:MAG: two pore domain potassium channel family protein [Porticoccaceae bacterium]|jgi:hypothetical protein|nr:MAG: two pore domain potassium channel family protein [Porticoccaceae bacterium]
MLYASTTSLLLIIGCVLFHYEALRFIGASAARVKQHRRAVLTVIFGVVGAHLAEILLYALAMYLGHRLGLGALAGEPHPRPAQYFYLSAETFTTLGLGDIYPTGDLRLIASLEPLIGMLLIGWSGSYTYLAVQRYWVDLQNPVPAREATRRERTRITGPRQRKRRSPSPAATRPDH